MCATSKLCRPCGNFPWFLLFLLSFSEIEVSKSCQFPSRWTGTWFQKGVQPPIRIEGDTFSFKGVCVEYSGDMFLIEDSRENCYRCVVIYEKHPNVLQYRETYCDEEQTLETACARLTVDAQLYSMFRVEAPSVECPFRGPFTFTYSRGHGECKYPVSTVDACTDDSHLLFRFQACADIIGTESSVEELKCLAIWKEGSAHYLVGKMTKQRVNLHGDEDTYRCFVYDYLQDRDGYQISQSADASCDGLVLSYEGSRIMLLNKSKSPTADCTFPNWLTGPNKWHSLDGRTTYVFNHQNTSFVIIRSHKDRSIGDKADTKIICMKEVASTYNSTTIIAYSMQGCTNGYMCLAFYQRDVNIVELETGEKARRLQDACQPPYYKSKVEYTTLVAPFADNDVCPQLVETDGLKINAGKVSLRSEDCRGSTAHVVGCRSRDTLEFLTTCATFKDRMTFQCHGWWEENEKTYLIAGLKNSKTKYCFVYTIDGIVTKLSALYDTCHRGIMPGITGNLTFNITAAGKCEYLLNRAPSQKSLINPLMLLMVACALMR